MRDAAMIASSQRPARAPDDTGNTVLITAQGRRGCLRLKVWLPADARKTHVPEFGGIALPASTGMIGSIGPADSAGSTVDGALRILCLAPGEWLVVANAVGTLEDHLRRWNRSPPSGGIAAVNVTDAFAIIRVRGRRSRAVLSKGCGLDFHSSQFPAGACARTLFAKVALIVDCVGAECFDLYCGRSYQAYLQAWLTDAALFAHLED
jgi:sarcosine oxidase subunit gamma